MNSLKTALISVFDKSELISLAKSLERHGIVMVSSGGTFRHLSEAGFQVREVSDVTGFPELLDGRVKTLHPAIHGGLLARRDRDDHILAIQSHGIEPIDILVSNLYPFEKTRDSGASFEDCVEQIDIGGPALIRAAAKNHAGVLVITDIADYGDLAEKLDQTDGIDQDYRRKLALKAFQHTSAYDAAIANWIAEQNQDAWPKTFLISGKRKQILRYGENPHQQAAFYETSGDGLARAERLQGKELSYNNIADADAAWNLVSAFDEPSVAIIKHANPCGCASAATIADAYDRALKADPVSAFGGIVAANRPLDRVTAEAITAIFTEVVIAPSINDDARPLFEAKPNLRLLITGDMEPAAHRQIKSVHGGLLVQDADVKEINPAHFKTVTKSPPSKDQIADMVFAFKVARCVKSNAIVLVKDRAIAGVGAGQMSRVDSVSLAVSRASAQGIEGPFVLASDAFFPFADGLEKAVEAGVVAVIQPGGSMRDEQVIAYADEAGIAMIFTGQRHFWH